MAPPTVLHVIPALGVGGAETMLAALVGARRSEPFDQAVVSLAGGGELAATIRAAGVPVYELGLTHPFATLPVVLRLSQLIRRLQPCAIQSWLYYADIASLWALGLSGRRSKTHLYWGIRCSDMDLSQYRPLLRWTIGLAARCSSWPDAVVANSFAGRDAHIRLRYSPRSFPVIPNGIDVDRFKPDAAARARIRATLGISNTTPLVIHVARVDPIKDHNSLILAARGLPDVHFLIVGSGTETLDAPPNVTALGKRSDLPSLNSAADFALSTSVSEGFSNVIAEAMATGLPVVATDVGDARRIIGQTGEVVPPRDPSAAAAAIRRLTMETETQRTRRAVASRQRIELYFSLSRAVAVFDALHLRGTLPDEEFC